jgi:predicted nucleic acid-binding protein
MRYRVEIGPSLNSSLQLCARKIHTTIPELIRNAIRDAFPYDAERRRASLTRIVGLWSDRRRPRLPGVPRLFWDPEGTPPPLRAPRGVLVDTGVLSEVLRGRDRILVNQWLDAVEHGTALVCSAMTIAEIWRAADYREMRRLGELCAAMLCLPVDSEVSRAAGEIAPRVANGKQLTMLDALITATAVLNQCEIWTRESHRYPSEVVSFFKPAQLAAV